MKPWERELADHFGLDDDIFDAEPFPNPPDITFAAVCHISMTHPDRWEQAIRDNPYIQDELSEALSLWPDYNLHDPINVYLH